MGGEVSACSKELGGELGGVNDVFQVSGRDKADNVHYEHYRKRKQQISEGDSWKEGISDGGIIA